MSIPDETGTLGQRIRKLRSEQRLTQEQLAKKSGVSKSFISEVEADSSKPRGPILVKLARALGASLDYLVAGDTNQSKVMAPVEIPPELDALARRQNIPYAHVTLLLGFASQVEAMRRANQREWTESEWEAFYESVKPHFAKFLGDE